MTQLRAVLLAPPGTQPKLLRWHHVWLAFALTGLGFCVGVLTLMLAATAYLKLNSTDLFLSYFLLEPMLLLLNVLPPILLIWFFYFLTRRAWAAFLGSFLPCVGLALVNYFKIRLRGDPLLAADLRLVTEAGGIVGHYQLDLTWLVWLCAACLILGLLFSVFLLPRGIGRGPLRWFCLCSSAALLAVSYAALYCDQSLYDRTANDTHITPWSDVEVFVSRGCLYPFLYSVQDMFPTPPEDYDPEEAASLLARYPDQDIPADRRVNVVGVMLEAFCDLTDFPALAEQPAVQAVYAPLHGLEEQSVSGDLLTNIFAGGTVDSEWGFLTGYTQHEDFRKPTDSYVWYFREQGYHTLFHHPGYSWFYNRQNVNEYLGFEESWFTENYYGALVDPVDAVMRSDETLVDGILDGLREPGPWFSFSVSYQNHGPYETASAQEVFLSPGDTGWSAETCNMLNNYMSLSPKQPENNFGKSAELTTYSRGMGAIGLPGDLSSASRFAKVAFTKLNSVSGDSEGESVSQFFHILGSVDQQRGCCEVSDVKYEITLYTSCCNADKGIYYYTTYNNHQICAVDMHKIDLDIAELTAYTPITEGKVLFQN